MAWTELPDAVNGQILTPERLNALRDNAIAIAQGLPNAPRTLQKKVFEFSLTLTGGNRDYWEFQLIREDEDTWCPLLFYISELRRDFDNRDETDMINSNRLLRVLSHNPIGEDETWAGAPLKLWAQRLPNGDTFYTQTAYNFTVNMWGLELANMA